MQDKPVDRRGLLAGGAVLAAGTALAAPVHAQSAAPVRGVYAPEPVALPFNPASHSRTFRETARPATTPTIIPAQ